MFYKNVFLKISQIHKKPPTLKELIFVRINFHEFRKFWPISKFPSFAKINSVLKFAKNAIFWLFFNHQIL